MTMALPKGRSVVAAGLAAITGAGVALGFTVLDSTMSTWLLILATAIPLASPFVAGWLSPELKHAWFFPVGVLASLSIATAIYGNLSLGACPRVNCHSEYRHDPPIRVMNTNPIELKRAFKATIIRCSSWSAISRTGC